jgi:predicted nucleic acid-binding protein
VAKRAVVDTGPLVATVRKREKSHKICVAALKTFRSPLLTSWPVLTEAAWLLRDEPGGIQAIGGLIRSGSIKLVELDESALVWIISFLERYASIGAEMADASLMYIAEREGIDTAFTLDRRDFWVYRTTDGRALDIVPEFLGKG